MADNSHGEARPIRVQLSADEIRLLQEFAKRNRRSMSAEAGSIIAEHLRREAHRRDGDPS